MRRDGDGEKQQQENWRRQAGGSGSCHVLMCVGVRRIRRKVVRESRDVIRWVLY